jgi:hypothetical protein
MSSFYNKLIKSVGFASFLTISPFALTSTKDILETPTYPGSFTPLPSFKATYSLNRRGSTYGEGFRSLTKKENGIYVFSYQTKARYFFLTDTRTERSEFKYTFLNEEWVASPLSYEFIREGTGKDKQYKVAVNYVNETISGRHKKNNPFPEDTVIQDMMTYQVQIRLDLQRNKPVKKYTVATRFGNWKDYDFTQYPPETITTPLGEYSSVKLTRTNIKKDRVTTVWLAPDLDYALIRLQQIEKGKENFDVVIKSYEVISN